LLFIRKRPISSITRSVSVLEADFDFVKELRTSPIAVHQAEAISSIIEVNLDFI
jgi:hypothetical protein